MDIKSSATKDTPKQTTKSVSARRVGQDKGMTLVEWWDGKTLHRAWVKPDMLTHDEGTEIEVDRPERGLPHGDDFSVLAQFEIESDAFATALHERGVWTYADVLSMGQDVLSALHAVYGIGLSNVLLKAQAAQASHEKKEKATPTT